MCGAVGPHPSAPRQFGAAIMTLLWRSSICAPERSHERAGMTLTSPDESQCWRDDGRYERLSGIDRAGLMWEWLRRDPDYIAWHARASTATRGTDPAKDPLQWGLHFRRASGPRSAGSADHLACRARSRDPQGRGQSGRWRRARSSRHCHSSSLADHRGRFDWPGTCRPVRRLAPCPDRRRGGQPRRQRACPA